MERPSWIAPLYGYVVCLTAVITFLVAASSLVNAVLDRSNPLYDRSGGPSLTSFEAYQATYDRDRNVAPGTRPDTLTTEQMRSRYEAIRSDRIASVTFQSTKQILSSGLMILLAAGLFVFHWRWVQRQKVAA